MVNFDSLCVASWAVVFRIFYLISVAVMHTAKKGGEGEEEGRATPQNFRNTGPVAEYYIRWMFGALHRTKLQPRAII